MYRFYHELSPGTPAGHIAAGTMRDSNAFAGMGMSLSAKDHDSGFAFGGHESRVSHAALPGGRQRAGTMAGRGNASVSWAHAFRQVLVR